MIKTRDLMMDEGKISKQVVTRQCLGGGGGEVGEWRRRCLAVQQVGGGVQRGRQTGSGMRQVGRTGLAIPRCREQHGNRHRGTKERPPPVHPSYQMLSPPGSLSFQSLTSRLGQISSDLGASFPRKHH